MLSTERTQYPIPNTKKRPSMGTTEVSTDRGSKISVRNPATGEVIGELACANARDVQQAIVRARAAQPAWWVRGERERGRILRRFIHLLNGRRDEVAKLITEENGK